MYGYIRPLTSDEIYHHGILGQKWGKRNGPPYPLGISNHSASERKAGWKKSLDGKNPKEYNRNSNSNNSSSKNDHKGLTDKQKKAIKIGAAVVGAALVVGGTVYLAKSGKLDGLINKGKNVVQPQLKVHQNSIFKQHEIGDFATLPDLKVHEYGDSFSKLPKGITEEARLARINPMAGVHPGTRMNCGNCAIANELSSRGFDVQAGFSLRGINPAHFGQYFTGMHKDTFKDLDSSINWESLRKSSNRSKECYDAIVNGLKSSYPDGSRGALFVRGVHGGRNIGHVMSFEIKNGVVKILNPQQPQSEYVNAYMNIIDYIPNKGGVSAMRLDDLKINMNNIGEVIADSKKSVLQLPVFDNAIIKGENFVMTRFTPKK